MEDAIDRRSVVTGSFTRDLPPCVAVAGKPWEVAACDLQSDGAAREKHVGRSPQIEPQFIDRITFEEFRLGHRCAVAGTQDALRQDHCPTIWGHIYQFARKI